MKLMGLLLGAVIGAAMAGVSGFILGGAIGFALALVVDRVRPPAQNHDGISERLISIETELAAMRARIQRFESRFAEPSDVTPPIEPLVNEDRRESMANALLPVESVPARSTEVQHQPAYVGRRHPVFTDAREPNALWDFVFGGNAMVRIGIVVLFFGVAFLLKYAAEHATVPIEFRLSGVALGAIALLGLGWRLRNRHGAYGLLLQGGGIGVLYLVIFASYRLWNLLPGGFTMLLLLAIAVLSAMLAILQNAPALALAGATGGFLAPVLASTGSGSHVALFSYYLVLNLGLLAIAWFKAWCVLNVVGFVFTFGIGALWGAKYYRPEHYATVEPFLVAFFVLYVAIAVLFALRRAPALKDYVDATLVFGTPLIGFGLQTQLVSHYEYGAAWSAVAMALFYLAIAQRLWNTKRESLRLLVECFLALGVVFGTLAIPLALDGRWTAAAWALEGLGAIWIGVRQDRALARAFGFLLQFAAGAAFLVESVAIVRTLPVLNSICLGGILIGAAGVYGARLLAHNGRAKTHELGASVVLLLWGAIWWMGAGFDEIMFQMQHPYSDNAMLAYGAASAVLFGALGSRWQWTPPRLGALALLPLMLLFAVAMWMESRSPSLAYGWLAWPFAVAALYYCLRKHESSAPDGMPALIHCVALWLLVALVAWEFGTRIELAVGGGRIWSLVAWPLVPIAAVLFITSRHARNGWPFSRHLETYLLPGAGVMIAFLYGWIWFANFRTNGDPAPLPYLPLLNPLDLTVMLAALVGMLWLRRAGAATEIGTRLHDMALPALGAAAFVWANGVLLRTLHHYAGVPFDLEAMLRSTLVQASLSVFWTALALAGMVWANRKGARPLWVAGAALLGLVVVKLFFLDLSRIEGVERIVSFIGVGLLMLLIGYLAPVPPSARESAQ